MHTRVHDLLGAILDGQGLKTDSGTHGQRGYEGDYLFAWFGCTTPFDRWMEAFRHSPDPDKLVDEVVRDLRR